MGFYVRPLPFVKVRITKRRGQKPRVRVGVGPRWLRVWTGAGGEGVSTGAGQFTIYKRLGSRKGRRR